jgi:AcrR family transcriptional regulator
VQKKKTSQRMGRPRSFDLNRALDRALYVFWRNGYEGTSLSELTKAMGISRPSLYAAFGDKGALFRKVLERYRDGPAAYTQDALNEKTARAVIARLLRGRRFDHGAAQSRGMPHGARRAGLWRRSRLHPPGIDGVPRRG